MRAEARRKLYVGRIISLQHPALRAIWLMECLKQPHNAALRQTGDPDLYRLLPPAFGLFAAEDIPAETVLLEYTGEVQHYHAWTAAPPNPHDLAYSMDVEPISCALPRQPRSRARSVADKLPYPPDRYWFKLDAAFRGNEVRYINDVRDFTGVNLVDAFACIDNPTLGRAKENTEFFQAFYQGWQHVIVCATKDIPAGQELWIDYGWFSCYLSYFNERISCIDSLSFLLNRRGLLANVPATHLPYDARTAARGGARRPLLAAPLLTAQRHDPLPNRPAATPTTFN